MVELELPGKSWTALNKVLAPREKKSQVHWHFLPLSILKQDLSFSIENCTRWLTGWQNVGMRRVMVQMANQHLIARRQISSGHDKSAGASRSSSKYFSAPGKIFPDHHQNISRASSEYFQIDDDLISTDFLIAVNSPVSRCSKFEANPFGMWDVYIIFSATIVIFAFVPTISTITYKEDPPPIFYQKVTQQISNFTAVVFLGRKAFPAWLLLDCEDVGKYQSKKKTIFECLFGCRKLLEPIV